MNERPQLFAVGVPLPELETIRSNLPALELTSADDAASAAETLRKREHHYGVVLLDPQALGEGVDAFVAYLRGSFADVSLAALGQIPEEERKRLKLLGVSHFFETPLNEESVELLSQISSEPRRRRGTMTDWSVTIDKSNWIEVTVPSKEDYVSRIQQLIDVLEQSRLDQDTRDELQLAVDELVRNAIEWGNRRDAEKQVRISYYCAEDRVILKVEDEGEGFNAAALRDPTEDLEKHMADRAAAGKRMGGLGLHLIRNLMDEVIHNDSGNVVMLTKYLDQGKRS